MEKKENFCTAILIGGQSIRLGGGIKSLKKFNNKFIFDRILEKIKYQSKEIIINCNESENLFKKYNFKIIKDIIPGYLGPLAGIHACLSWLISKKKNIDWLVTIPGDTPFIPFNLVDNLFNRAINDNHEIVLAKSNGKIHPIIGIWNLKLHKSLEKEINLGGRKILNWATKHSLGYAEFNNTAYDPFFNINYKEDLIIAEEIENKYFEFI